MFRQAISLAILTLMFSGVVLRAEDSTAAAQGRAFKPIWTAVGAGAGFGLGVWVGLTKFDDAIDSDRKVWTTATASVGDRTAADEGSPDLVAACGGTEKRGQSHFPRACTRKWLCPPFFQLRAAQPA